MIVKFFTNISQKKLADRPLMFITVSLVCRLSIKNLTLTLKNFLYLRSILWSYFPSIYTCKKIEAAEKVPLCITRSEAMK